MKTAVLESFLIKLLAFKEGLQHRCFSVNIVKYLRPAFFITLPVAASKKVPSEAVDCQYS